VSNIQPPVSIPCSRQVLIVSLTSCPTFLTSLLSILLRTLAKSSVAPCRKIKIFVLCPLSFVICIAILSKYSVSTLTVTNSAFFISLSSFAQSALDVTLTTSGAIISVTDEDELRPGGFSLYLSINWINLSRLNSSYSLSLSTSLRILS
jgi:hypothetical protein